MDPAKNEFWMQQLKMIKRHKIVIKLILIALGIAGGSAAYAFSAFGPDHDLLDCLAISLAMTYITYVFFFE